MRLSTLFGLCPDRPRASGPVTALSLLVVFGLVLDSIFPKEISITTVYAGKKKFRSYNLGIPLLPTLVKVRPNRFSLSFRQSRYIRPPKFNIEGSIPLKVPTIIMKKPDPYEKVQVVNLFKDIKLGVEEDKPKKSAYREQYAAATDEQEQAMPAPSEDQQSAEPQQDISQIDPSQIEQGIELPPMPPPPPFPFGALPPYPFMPPFQQFTDPHIASLPIETLSGAMPGEEVQLPPGVDILKGRSHTRTRRSLNLREPYHHHVSKSPKQAVEPSPPPPPPFPPMNMEQFLRPMPPSPFKGGPYGFPHYGPQPGYYHPFPPRAMFAHYPPPPQMYPMPYQVAPEGKEEDSLRRQQVFVDESDLATQPQSQQQPVPLGDIAVDPSQQALLEEQQRQLVPMKINIGEHYNPNLVYMDESIVPNLEDTSLMDALGANGLDEPLGMESSYQQQYTKAGYKNNKGPGPDDFRLSFSFSGVHGGPLVPLGTGDNIEQYYRQLKNFEGNNVPAGLPPDQLYKYYQAHTFTNGIKVYRMTPAKVIKSKLLKALLG